MPVQEQRSTYVHMHEAFAGTARSAQKVRKMTMARSAPADGQPFIIPKGYHYPMPINPLRQCPPVWPEYGGERSLRAAENRSLTNPRGKRGEMLFWRI